MLWLYIPNESYVIRWAAVQLDEWLSFIDKPISILSRDIMRLHSRVILVAKVQLRHRPIDEFTLEVESEKHSSYPHFLLI